MTARHWILDLESPVLPSDQLAGLDRENATNILSSITVNRALGSRGAIASNHRTGERIVADRILDSSHRPTSRWSVTFEGEGPANLEDAAQALADRLAANLGHLGDTMASLTCGEADMIADLVRLAGYPQQAWDLLAIHRSTDEADDLHNQED